MAKKSTKIKKAVRKVYTFFEKTHAPSVTIETPDSDLNDFVNHWLPEQTLRIGRRLRHVSSASARNALIDPVGAVYTDPSQVRHWYPVIFGQQEVCGYLPHGIPLFKGVVPGGINVIRHRDAATWAPPLLLYYIGETGDMAAQAVHGSFVSQPGAGAWLVESGYQGFLGQQIAVSATPGDRLQLFGDVENVEELVALEFLE